MKIIIFGGKGFLGKNLSEHISREHEVLVWDLPEFDIRKPEIFRERLRKEKPDAVINLAAILGTMLSSPSTREMFETNVQGNLNFLEAVKDASVPHYVFTSSMTVHGENAIGKHQLTTSSFNPKHTYSASKASAEYSMMQFAKENPAMRITVLRPTMILGEGTYLPHAPIEFIKTVLSGKEIEIFGEGRHEREWIWIDDVSDGIMRALKFSPKDSPGYHAFFISGNRISMRDLAEKVAGELGGKVRYVPSTKQAFTLTADSLSSYEALGWKPKHSMDEMIKMLTLIIGSKER